VGEGEVGLGLKGLGLKGLDRALLRVFWWGLVLPLLLLLRLTVVIEDILFLLVIGEGEYNLDSYPYYY
jgi:hypothetical protein